MASATGGFDITPSPAFKRASQAMQVLKIGEVVVDATMRTSASIIPSLRQSATAAGASKKMVGAITVINARSGGLVMRQAAEGGDTEVGVPGSSEHAEEADDLEWGGLTESPKAWVRNWFQHEGGKVNERWSRDLTSELNRRLA